MTEEDLKKTWCPHARMPLAASTSVRGTAGTPATFIVGNLHGDGSVPKEALCRGSACSQWRWKTIDNIGVVMPQGHVTWMSAGSTYAVEPSRPEYITKDWRWDREHGCWVLGENAVKHGGCGLASHKP